MKHDFHQRKGNRTAYAEHQALKSEAESDQLYLRSKEMAGVIPIGQPILVGHHSQNRDRRYREKIEGAMRRSIEAGKKADYYADKAQSIRDNDAIFSDDPQALLKLEQKLGELKDRQGFMRAANKCLRKKDREGFLMLDFASAELWEKLMNPEWGGVGFAAYSLSNNNANIRRIEKRIAALKAQPEGGALHVEINGLRIFENREANRLQLFFEGKPEADVISQLKRHGFRWCRSQLAWQRHISNNAFYWARQIALSVNFPASI